MALHARSFDVVIQRFYWLSGRSTRHTISDLGILSLRLNIPQSPTSSDYFQQLPHRKFFLFGLYHQHHVKPRQQRPRAWPTRV